MDKLYKTNAIVLKKRNWREDDLLFSFYTENYGKVEAVAVGAQKIKSKLAGHLSSLGQVELIFVKGKTVNRITHAYLVKHFVIGSHDEFNYLSAVLEIVEKAAPTDLPTKEIWDILLWALEELNKSKNINGERKFIINLFILKVLNYIGYDLHTGICVKCKNTIDEVRRFSFTNHGFVCAKCRGGEINVSQTVYDIIRRVQNEKNIAELKITPKMNDELFIFLRRYVIYFLEKEINSLSFIV